MSEKQKTVLIVVAFFGLLLVILVGFFHFLSGRGIANGYARQTQDLEGKIGGLEREVADINRLLNEEGELERREQKIEKIRRRLPSSPEAPGFLKALRSILQTTGIHQQLVASAGASADRQRLSQQQVFRQLINTPLYGEIPYIVRADGRYHQIGQFLTLLEQNPDRFMRLKYIKLTNNLSHPSIHPVEMVVATFMFKDVRG